MWPHCRPASVAFLLGCLVAPALAQEPQKPESSYVKLLTKAPAERVGQIVEIIGKRGSVDDLAVVYDRAITDGGFLPAVRLKAFEILEEAALTRDLRPKVDLAGLNRLMGVGSPDLKLSAVKLAGPWKAEATVPLLAEIAGSKESTSPLRASAFDSLATVNSPAARKAIESLADPRQPSKVRALAIAGLAHYDLDQAASKAVSVLNDDARIEEVAPLIAAILDRRNGADKLAAVLQEHPATLDGSRLALRAVYAMGRSDQAVIAALSKSAGIEAEPKLPTKPEMDALVQEVLAKGNSERGEQIFRRNELNCMKCHAITGAAGGVGPELSSLGLSSPVDYVVNSILIPDQAIKEEFQTRQVLTEDGRALQGIVVEEDDKKLVLKDATGERVVIPVSSIEESKRGGSLMPKGLAGLLTHAEFLDLVRFLSELGKPGPYAFRPIPTLQRWRVLKTSPDDIAGVLQAEPALWSPAYGQTNGALPLGDVTALTSEKVVYLQGEITVSAAGPLTFRFNSAQGLTAWLDDQPLPSGDAPTIEVREGSHKLTLRVEMASRKLDPIRVEVARPEGSSVQYSVVGGR